jgi:hypothetical protein
LSQQPAAAEQRKEAPVNESTSSLSQALAQVLEGARQRHAHLKRTGFVLDVFDVRHANSMIRRAVSLERVAAVKDVDIATLQRDRAMLELVDMIARFRCRMINSAGP